MSRKPGRLLLDERLDDDGVPVPLHLVARPGGELALVEQEQTREIPPRAIAAVMRRYGRELEPGVSAGGDFLDLSGLGRLQRLRFRAAVDADGRDYLVWTEPGRPPVAAIARHVAAALRYLAGPPAQGSEPLAGGGDPLAEAARLLGRARSVLFVTGAGVSADSGLPTYRGVGGLYERDVTEEGIPIEVALSGEMMQSRPELCWKYIAQVEAACRGARPNRAHEVIAEVERRVERCWVLTQNVDGFHLDAGSENVIEIHGSVRRLACTRCDHRERRDDYSELEIPPRCPACSGLVRPRVVLFGEMLPLDQFAAMQEAFAPGFDLVISVGTTSVFPYIAAPVVEARRAGVPSIEINPSDSEVSELVTHRIRDRAAVALDELLRRAF